MSCRASEKNTGALVTGQASISMSLESMVLRPVCCSASGGASCRDEPAQRNRHRYSDHLLGAGPLQQAAIHGGDADGCHHEPDAALQCDALNAGTLHEFH